MQMDDPTGLPAQMSFFSSTEPVLFYQQQVVVGMVKLVEVITELQNMYSTAHPQKTYIECSALTMKLL